ncbi:PP2C family protein-serine/threonine phosphatase [Cryptosporangium sp. NPDC048952]|uniref:PP2C family protein-serine/threonine phosphatase n=1 Tax=Cryptosporangium sp. NPDC048952 TaxID=3363961 RepID=UPI00371D3ADE
MYSSPPSEAQRLADEPLRHSQLLLSASEALQGAMTVDDVIRAVADLVSGDLVPSHVGIMLLDPVAGQLNLVTTDPLPPGPAERWATVPVASDQSAARAVRERRPLFFRDRDEFREAFPDQAGDLDEIGWEALVCAPLMGGDGPLGTLRFAWADPQRLDVSERAVILSLASYVTQALERANHLHDRITVAETLQRAMLPVLPAVAPYELAAHYQPAHRIDQVGGDWYDAVCLPDGRLALVIGDVTGHDIGAAASMGALRNMLRAYLLDEGISPSGALSRLDLANNALGDRTMATAFVATLEHDADQGLVLRWSPAGHPPPILLCPDGRSLLLSPTGLMLGVRPHLPRLTHTEALPSGSTLLLYTDGLVEVPGTGLDEGIERLQRFVEDNGDLPLDRLLDALLTDHRGYAHHDDVAMLALRVP